MLKFLSLLAAVLSSNLFADSIKLTEKKLDELAQKGAPQLDQIEAAFLSAAVRESETKERYAPYLFGEASYLETQERAVTAVQPIFSPIKQAQLGVKKDFSQGFETSAYVVTDQRSAQNPFIGRLNNVTTTTLAFTAQMDLWKNLLGRVTKKQLENASLDKERAKIEKEIQLKAFKISLRRLYWSLVANQESAVIAEALLKTARQQLNEAKLRLKNAVAEPDEVARYEAQVASREGTQLYLEYQKEIFIKQLRNLLPELSQYDITLEKYDLNKTVSEVLLCTATIAQQEKIPYQFTHYDEVVSMLRKIKGNNSDINSRYSDADVKLFGTVKSTGIGSEQSSTQLVRGSYGASIDDQTGNNRTGYEVGVSFTLPLGSVKEGTEKVKKLYDEKRLEASINATDSQVVSTHQQLSKSIALLTDVIRAQRVSSEQLSKRLQIMKRKYQQARVTVDQLVLDQDALLNSELTTIETQLQILNTLFDYLVIYTETPCTFNRI
ncbi:MAG: TolC family protein [Bacteriovoracia bacterium]